MVKGVTINKSLNYIKEWFSNPARKRDKITVPTSLNFPITDNCNSRCLMCNVWQDTERNELTPVEIASYFSDPALAELKHVGISGGEPSLRKDLVDCIDAITRTLPKQQSLSITSHGYHYNRWSRFLPQIIEITQSRNIDFSLNLSLDGIGEIHNQVRGIKTAFQRVSETLKISKALNVSLQLQCTVSQANVYHVGRVLAFAKQQSVEVIFRCATTIERLYNAEIMPAVGLKLNQKSFLADFFLCPALHQQTSSPARRLYYKKMATWLVVGGPRPFPCYFQNEGVLITSLGDVYSCSVTEKKLGSLRGGSATDAILSAKAIAIRESVKISDCPNCIHDQTGAWSPTKLIIDQLEQSRAVRYVSQFGKFSRAAADIIIGAVNRNLPRSLKKNNKHALLIGAYGGEHLGDAAILGGVIQRMVNEHQLQFITVASFRPHRTLMWVEMLDLPIEVKVILNSAKAINEQLNQAAYVVYAGGPLMELPAHLAKHLAVFSKARKKGAHLIIEGVGLGPLFSLQSKYFVKTMLRISDVVSIRTKIDKVKDLLPKSKTIAEVRDPAFDYLHSQSLDRIEKCSSKKDIDHFTKTALIKIAINLRPLWKKYNFDKNISTVNVEKEFLKALSVAMLKLQIQHGVGLSFYFFPMNSDQFGMSDLNMAYQLDNILDKSINFSIWEAEPDFKSMLYFMNKMDCILSMRFHGCVFAMIHCKDRLVGIDYQIGKAGKVAQLMQENRREENYLSVSNIDSELIVERINAVLKIIPTNSISDQTMPITDSQLS